MIMIKKAKLSDIKIICEMADVIWKQTYLSILPSGQTEYMLKKFQSEQAIKDDINDNGYEYYLIQTDGADCGYLATKVEGDVLYMAKLYLMRFARGKGLGRQALDYVTQLAKEKKCNFVRLTVNNRNERAKAVYKKCGFEVYAREKTDIGGGYFMDDYYMKKSVKIL